MSEHCCPKCSSKAFKRNGFTRHGKQNHRCLECGRQFSLDIIQDEHVIDVQAYQIPVSFDAKREESFAKLQ